MADFYGNLFDYLLTPEFKALRKPLYSKLDADINDAYLYYIVPLSNLEQIFLAGGINCRSEVKTLTTDLSGPEVQNKRHFKLQLFNQYLERKNIVSKNIHQCINLFWNPINKTTQSFQRSGLLLSVSNSNYNAEILCIIEISLRHFINSEYFFWCSSKSNLSSNAQTSFSNTLFNVAWPWERIFAINGDNRTNSAEFIVFGRNEDSENSCKVPIEYINRIIVPSQYIHRLNSIKNNFNINIFGLNDEVIFPPQIKLLYTEIQFVKNLVNLQIDGVSVERFAKVLSLFNKVYQISGINVLPEYFQNSNIAYSFHGIGHVTRVMFWSLFLHNLSKLEGGTSLIQVLLAAFLHDLCRQNNSEEPTHGKISAQKANHIKLVSSKVGDKSKIDEVIRAVEYHSLPDEKFLYPFDNTWQILKDADALDRGRFGLPGTDRGCNIRLLRLSILQKNKRITHNLAWLAYRLALLTKFHNWTENTYTDFVSIIITSINATIKYDLLSKEKERLFASKIVALCSQE
jgi:hypothetical protein